MKPSQTIPEGERIEAAARRLLADLLAYRRRYAPIRDASHMCRVFDERQRCKECGRDGNRAPDVITVFVGTLGQWWVNAVGGGKETDYVPVSIVLPILRAFLAQREELRRLSVELSAQRGTGACESTTTVELRSIADAVWAVAKESGVSEAGRKLKHLSSRLHELATATALDNAPSLGTCEVCGRVTLVVNGKCSNGSICRTGKDGPDHYP